MFPNKLVLISPLLLAAGYFLYKKWQKTSPKSLYYYTRQPWVDHIFSYLDEGKFYEAEELCENNIKKYPQVEEYKLLQIKTLIAAGNLPRASIYLKEYLDSELEENYRFLFNFYSAYLLALENSDLLVASKLFSSYPSPDSKAPYYGLYELWCCYLNQDSHILDNFARYSKATTCEQAERNYLAGITILKIQPSLAATLLQKAIACAPKSYFARKSQVILENINQLKAE